MQGVLVQVVEEVVVCDHLGGHDGGVDGDGDHGVEARDRVVYPAAVLSGHEAMTMMVHVRSIRLFQVKSWHFEKLSVYDFMQ